MEYYNIIHSVLLKQPLLCHILFNINFLLFILLLTIFINWVQIKNIKREKDVI